MPYFPLLYLLVATPLAHAARNVSISQGLRAIYVWLLILFLTTAPALALMGYYRGTINSGATNQPVLSLHASLRQLYSSGAVSEVLIDKKLSQDMLGGGGNVQRALEYLFTLDNTAYRTIEMAPDAVRAELRKSPSRAVAVVISTDSYKSLASQIQLSPLEGQAEAGPPGKVKYAAYLASGNGATP
ncbi:MAG: hypothetical protein M1370_02520 [Bacteroidetes bacterium]|nr:hypothetical protein [Bacteroidota bacterium]